MTPAVRERVWAVLVSWWQLGGEASIVMTWPDAHLPGGQELRTLGTPARDTVKLDGMYAARRDLTPDDRTRIDERLPTPGEIPPAE